MSEPDLFLGPVVGHDRVADLLIRQSFAVLDVGALVPWSLAAPIFEGLRRLRELSPEDQVRWNINRSRGAPNDPDDGLLIRRANTPNPDPFNPEMRADNKNVFMFRPQARGWLAERCLGIDSTWDSFWSGQQHLWSIAWGIALQTAGALDVRTDRCYRIQDGLLACVCQTKMRSQAYVGPRADDPETIALTHTDRSCITVHLCEDHPGLLIMPGGRRIHVPALPGRVIIFAGSQLQLMTGGHVRMERLPNGKNGRVFSGGLVRALEHGAAFIDTTEHPWPGHRHMCVLFAKGQYDDNDAPYGIHLS